MSDIPNPLAAFDIFNSRFEDMPKKFSKLRPLKKLFSKKIAKKLFGKKFALKPRALTPVTQDHVVAKPASKPKRPAFQITWASTPNEVKEAQRLRFKVFACLLYTSDAADE